MYYFYERLQKERKTCMCVNYTVIRTLFHLISYVQLLAEGEICDRRLF